METSQLIKELENDPEIIIISGEGNQGTIEKYTGTKTARAIKMKLIKERENGQRFARAYIKTGDYWTNIDDTNDRKSNLEAGING